MVLKPGAHLGPYEILAPLGAGGMGEVYRARDTRLGREVAVKVLPESLSKDPDRLRRFEQEARAASQLNHPNIVTVHDFGTHERRALRRPGAAGRRDVAGETADGAVCGVAWEDAARAGHSVPRG